jgi:hypothetical protein
MITTPASSTDVTDSFIQYVQATKPYHTKLVEVEVEYITPDPVSIGMVERYSWTIEP